MDKFYFRKVGVALYEGTSTNGMQYVLSPIKGLKSKFFGVLVPKGGLLDEIEINGTKIPLGTAHLLEHRVFETANGDTLKEFTSAGAFANAYTTQSCTFYYFLTSKDYHRPLKTLFSMFSSFYQTNEKIDHEKPIILGELASKRDDPSYQMDQLMLDSLYFSSPIKEEILGNEKSLQAIHLSTVKKFFEQYYSADKLTFFATGDFNPEELEKEISSFTLPKFVKKTVKTNENKEDYSKVHKPLVHAPSSDGQTYLGVGIKFPPRKKLYEKFGDDLFAFYEIAGKLVFSSANRTISDMRRDGLIIFADGSSIEEAGEDTYLESFFETNAPERLRQAFEVHFSKLVKSYNSYLSPLHPLKMSYLGYASQIVTSPEDYVENLTDSFLNHFAWPALVSRVLTFKKKDVVNFLTEVVKFPRAYVILEGKKGKG